jgi:hypothetical protein
VSLTHFLSSQEQTQLLLFRSHLSQSSFIMKLIFILSLATFFGTALSSIKLPENLADGTYILSFDNDGKEVWTDITASVIDAPPHQGSKFNVTGDGTTSNLHKRSFNWPSGTYASCPGGDWFLQKEFYDRSWNSFWNACRSNGNHKFPRGTGLFQTQGTALSYMCSFTENPCATAEWEDAVNWVAGNCIGRSNGWMEPGMLLNGLG